MLPNLTTKNFNNIKSIFLPLLFHPSFTVLFSALRKIWTIDGKSDDGNNITDRQTNCNGNENACPQLFNCSAFNSNLSLRFKHFVNFISSSVRICMYVCMLYIDVYLWYPYVYIYVCHTIQQVLLLHLFRWDNHLLFKSKSPFYQLDIDDMKLVIISFINNDMQKYCSNSFRLRKNMWYISLYQL